MIVYVVGEDVKFSLKFLDLEWNDALLNENSDYYLMMERIVMGNVSSFSFATGIYYQQPNLINLTNINYAFLFALQMTVQFMNLRDIRNLKILGFRFVKMNSIHLIALKDTLKIHSYSCITIQSLSCLF